MPSWLRPSAGYALIVVALVVAGLYAASDRLMSFGVGLQARRSLHDAIRNEDLSRLIQLLEFHSNPNRTDDRQNTALHYVLKLPLHEDVQIDMVKALVEHGADSAARDSNGDTVLMTAVKLSESLGDEERRWEVVQILLDAGADPNARNDAGWTPLSRAGLRGFDEAIPLLLDAGAEVGIFEAVVMKDSAKVAALLQEDPERANAEMLSWVTPLMLAVYKCDLNSMRLLLKADAFVDAQARSGYSPLHFATQYGWDCYEETVRQLLDLGADPNLRSVRHLETPLHFASKGPSANVVRMLLEADAEVDPVNVEGLTPLMLAAAGSRGPDLEFVLLLLAAGADPNLQSSSGETPLFYAKTHETARALLEHGADPNLRNRNGIALLARVVASVFLDAQTRIEFSRTLLEFGAEPNFSLSGRSALSYAASSGDTEIVEIFLRHGAEPNVEDPSQRTPLAIAKEAGNQEIVDLLIAHGAVDLPQEGAGE